MTPEQFDKAEVGQTFDGRGLMRGITKEPTQWTVEAVSTEQGLTMKRVRCRVEYFGVKLVAFEIQRDGDQLMVREV